MFEAGGNVFCTEEFKGFRASLSFIFPRSNCNRVQNQRRSYPILSSIRAIRLI